MSGRSSKLDGVHPELVERLVRVMTWMNLIGFQMLVTDGVRTLEEQQALYAKGRTEPGQIVTDCDGIHKISNHQVKIDGFGHAVDCCFIVGGKASWDDILPWEVYGSVAKYHGLKWGIKLANGTIDRPHVEF